MLRNLGSGGYSYVGGGKLLILFVIGDEVHRPLLILAIGEKKSERKTRFY